MSIAPIVRFGRRLATTGLAVATLAAAMWTAPAAAAAGEHDRHGDRHPPAKIVLTFEHVPRTSRSSTPPSSSQPIPNPSAARSSSPRATSILGGHHQG